MAGPVVAALQDIVSRVREALREEGLEGAVELLGMLNLSNPGLGAEPEFAVAECAALCSASLRSGWTPPLLSGLRPKLRPTKAWTRSREPSTQGCHRQTPTMFGNGWTLMLVQQLALPLALVAGY